MTIYTLQWQNDTTNQVQELGVGQYNTLSKAVNALEYHFHNICKDANYTCGAYDDSFLCLYIEGQTTTFPLYSVQCVRPVLTTTTVYIGFIGFQTTQHPLLDALEARLVEQEAWQTNTPAVLTTLAKRYKLQCSVVYIYPDGTEYPIRVDADGDLIDEIPDCWADADYEDCGLFVDNKEVRESD